MEWLLYDYTVWVYGMVYWFYWALALHKKNLEFKSLKNTLPKIEKNFQCKFCEAKFPSRGYYGQHMKKEHPEAYAKRKSKKLEAKKSN